MEWSVVDWIGLGWIGLDWIGLVWIGLDWFGLVWIDLDWFGLDCFGLDWICVGGCVCPLRTISCVWSKVRSFVRHVLRPNTQLVVCRSVSAAVADPHVYGGARKARVGVD